jgi:hypothetical protein
LILVVSAGALRLDGASDFKAFKVAAEAGAEARLSDLGRVDGDHVWVRPQLLQELVGALASDAGWQAGLQGMVEFARKHEWVDHHGAIRAHTERA